MPTTVVTTFSFKTKFYSWLLIMLSYLATFVTPMIAAYYLLASDVVSEHTKGGIFYFIVIGIFGGGLAITLTKLINKQKANIFKTIFKLGVKTGLILAFMSMINYISFNLDNLQSVLWIGLSGFILGSIIEAFAVFKYPEYLREVGVF